MKTTKPMNNSKSQYVVESLHENDIYHEQTKAITTLKNGRVIDARLGNENGSESETVDNLKGTRVEETSVSKGGPHSLYYFTKFCSNNTVYEARIRV